MPELPEVETIRRDLAEHILNQSVASIHILSAKTAHNPAAFFKKSLQGREFQSVSRRGKLLIFDIRDGDFLLVHLKMTGQLIYIDKKRRVAGGHSSGVDRIVDKKLPGRHTRVWLEFKNGGRLFFNDLRKFGYWKIVGQAELDKILRDNYGPEPLTGLFTVSSLSAVAKGKKVKIKALLLDQKRIAGLGNIYVDEALWLAGIKPTRLAQSLSSAEIKKLWQAINKVIAKAIKYRGTTFSDYVDSRGQKGNFSNFLQVYGRAGEKCARCGGTIKKEKIAGRGTHYCTNCQK
ncbi:MAG: bifunctional DNA-formamidopyrimidine glycosylase/DNA-(apurinic or apyrimidinic site) lyase [Patescibacteria group bacterium]|jgi:formamidopyrimidine-DNA glycosylase